MAELSVKVEYASKLRQATLHLMRMAFPIWGIMPVLMILGIAATLSMNWFAVGFAAKNAVMLVINVTFFAAFVILASLLTIRVLEKSKLLIDKNGIELPLELSLTGG